MLKSIGKRHLRFLDHVMREEELESVCLLVKNEGRRGKEDRTSGWVIPSPTRLLQLTRLGFEWRRMIDYVFRDTSLQ